MKLITKQVLKDYEKVQSTECLKLWTGDDCCKDEELLKLPLGLALSDIDTQLDNMQYEVNECEGEERKKMQARIRSAKAFLKKYTKGTTLKAEIKVAFEWYEGKD